MNLYIKIGASVGTSEAASLCEHLRAWHEALGDHERRIRDGGTADECDEGCEHAEARLLWREAVVVLGSRAYELTVLRSRALGAGIKGAV